MRKVTLPSDIFKNPVAYKCFDKDNNLLFMGYTTNYLSSMWSRTLHCGWFEDAVKIEIFPFPTKEEARGFVWISTQKHAPRFIDRDRVVIRRANKGIPAQKRLTPEYAAWVEMKRRCSSPLHVWYKNYGGRGIKVCERWMDYDNFLSDMGNKPSPQHTLDRLDNDKGYEPDNCTWRTRAEQARNKRNNVWVTIKGKTKIITDWCRELDLDNRTVRRMAQSIRVGYK